MTDEHDASNPFRKLAKDYAVRKAGDASLLSPSGAVRRTGPVEARRKVAPPGALETAPETAQDAALFLDAVGRIAPPPKKRQRGGPDMGEALAARLRENQGGSPSRAAAPAVGAGAGKIAPPPPEVEFGDAMESLFASGKGREFSPPGNADSGPAETLSAEERNLFAKAMQGVGPVNGRGRDLAPPAEARQAQPLHDPAKALREILEGRVEFALQHSDEFMEGFAVGLDPLIMARLRAGRYSPEKHLDLHGMNARQAHDALTQFMKNAYQRNMRCVVVVTGRGRNSPGGVGVLRPMLQQWLCRDPFKRVVLAFCTARPGDGGPGAVYVLLRKYKKSRGKIIWERTPSDDDFPDV